MLRLFTFRFLLFSFPRGLDLWLRVMMWLDMGVLLMLGRAALLFRCFLDFTLCFVRCICWSLGPLILTNNLVLLFQSVICMVRGVRYVMGSWVSKDRNVEVRLSFGVCSCKSITVWGELSEEFPVSPSGPVGPIQADQVTVVREHLQYLA